MLNQALNEPVTLRTGKRAVTTTKAAAGIAQLVTQFAEGDRHARRDLIALAPKLGIDLTAGQAGAIGEAVATLMTASDEAIIADFLRRHGVEPKLDRNQWPFDRQSDPRRNAAKSPRRRNEMLLTPENQRVLDAICRPTLLASPRRHFIRYRLVPAFRMNYHIEPCISFGTGEAR